MAPGENWRPPVTASSSTAGLPLLPAAAALGLVACSRWRGSRTLRPARPITIHVAFARISQSQNPPRLRSAFSTRAGLAILRDSNHSRVCRVP